MKVLLIILKYGILAVIYLFIIKLFHFIVTDLRRVSAKAGDDYRNLSVSGAELVVTGSSDSALREGAIIKLGVQTRIGRGRGNDIRMSDTYASHEHARIIFDEESFFLEDLGSINGTYINGIRITEPVPLKHGDNLKVAGVTFRFVRWEYEVE